MLIQALLVASTITLAACALRIARRATAVGELAGRVTVSRPAVSQHLKVLKDAGLVVDTRAGKQRIDRVDPDGLAALRAEIDLF